MRVTILFFILFLVIASTHSKNLHSFHEQQSQHTRNTDSGLEASLIGFIMGPIVFILTFIIIFNNERKAEIEYRRIKLIQSIVHQINPFNDHEVKQAEGKLVYVTGETESKQKLIDSESGISLDGAIKIQRVVQVREMRVYNNKTQVIWSHSNQPSPGAGLTNDPAAWFITSKKSQAKNITLGVYTLSDSLINSLECKENYIPTLEQASNISKKFHQKAKNDPKIQGNYIYFPTEAQKLDAVGTLRVKYSYCPAGQTTIISQSTKNTFTPFQIDIHQNNKEDDFNIEAQNNSCCLLCDCTSGFLAPLKQIDLIAQKKLKFYEIMESKRKSIGCKKHLIRVLAFCLMVFSICAFFSPTTYLLGYIPLIGGAISNAFGVAIFVAALIICIPLFLISVAICWVIFHPKVGAIFLGIGLLIGGAVAAAIYLRRGQGAEEFAAESAHHLFYVMRSFI